jgi:pimeloyl-ACP methyl ester carboxylesterase
LAGEWLRLVRQPTLLIVGELDVKVIQLNQHARDKLSGPSRLMIVPRASHLFEEPGALEKVAQLASAWFVEHLAGPG